MKLLANTSIKSNFLIIISHSARALSESAYRVGYNVISVDGFADTDTLEVCSECWCLPLVAGEFVPSQIETCLSKLKVRYPSAKVLLGAGAEHFAADIEQILGWRLMGCSSQVTCRINNPTSFFNGLESLMIPYPAIRYSEHPECGEWLYKRSDSCGGTGVIKNPSDNELEWSGYWQKEISAQSISALYITDGKNAQCIGINQQYSLSFFEHYPYLYHGLHANIKLDKKYLYLINSYADNLIEHFNIVGVFSVDMLLSQQGQQEVLYVLEVNPRISASYELYERVNPGLNLVDEHIRVCEGERLSKLMLNQAESAYSIVYTRSDCQIKAGIDWPVWSKDIPEAGRQVLSGEPLCSVYADQQEGEIKTLLHQREKEILNIINQ